MFSSRQHIPTHKAIVLQAKVHDNPEVNERANSLTESKHRFHRTKSCEGPTYFNTHTQNNQEDQRSSSTHKNTNTQTQRRSTKIIISKTKQTYKKLVARFKKRCSPNNDNKTPTTIQQCHHHHVLRRGPHLLRSEVLTRRWPPPSKIRRRGERMVITMRTTLGPSRPSSPPPLTPSTMGHLVPRQSSRSATIITM